jgi:hypothetical protein
MRSQLLQVLWFANSVVQNTVMYLRRQGAIDHRWACRPLAVAIAADGGLPAVHVPGGYGSKIAATASRHRCRWSAGCAPSC